MALASGDMASLASISASNSAPAQPVTPEALPFNDGDNNDLSMQSWSGNMTPEAMASLSSKAPQAQMLEDPALCGVGLYFERQDANGRTIIKQVTPRGSAAREGSLEVGDAITHIDGISCVGWPMNQLKSAILGVPGTNVNVTAHKASGRIVEIVLVRGNPEYWNFHDMNQRLRKDVAIRDKEIEALKKKLKEMEGSMRKDRAEVESLNSQIASLERLNNKLQIDMDREVDLRKRAENMVNGLTSEKKHLEDQIESLLKKVSEITLSFKSSQSLAKEMTEKARQSEQARANEEKLRKLAETRETRAQNLLLEEISRRKQAESDTAVIQMKLTDQTDREAREKSLNEKLSKLQNDVLELQGQLAVAVAESESHKKYIAKVQEENKNALVKAQDAEMRLLAAQSEIESGSAQLKILQSAVATAEESKKAALDREADAVKKATEHHHNHRSSESKAANHEVSAEGLKSQLEQAAADIAEKAAAEKQLAVELSSTKSELNKMKHSLEELERNKELQAKEYEDKLRFAKQDAAALQERVTASEEKVRQLMSELSSKEREMAAQLAQRDATELALNTKIAQLESELGAIKDEGGRVKQKLAELEARLAAALGDADRAEQAARITTAELKACTSARQQVEEEQGKTLAELEKARAGAWRMEQEREAAAASLQDAVGRSTELNAQLIALQAKLRGKSSEAEALAARVQDVEAQLAALLDVRKQVVAAEAQARDAKHLADALTAENALLTEKELKTRGEVRSAVTKIGELESELTDQKLELLNDYKSKERSMREELAQVINEREGLQAELSRYYSLPNPTGVGMSLEETIERLPTGGTVKTLKVKELMAGMSADLSGVVQVGDDVLEVDNVNCVGLSLEELKAKIAGKRGTKVTLKMMRDTSDDQVQNGVEYMVTLKRGAWGPEHCVLSPEDRDMVDKGRWPKPGALSEEINVAHIDRVTSGATPLPV